MLALFFAKGYCFVLPLPFENILFFTGQSGILILYSDLWEGVMRKKFYKKLALYTIFAVYISILLKLTIFRQQTLTECGINIVPFADLVHVYKTCTTWQFLRLFLGNIVWFVPFGFMLPLLRKCGFLLTIISGFGFSFLIEITQLISKKGFFEVDDLILNTFGAMIGYAIYRLISFLKN